MKPLSSNISSAVKHQKQRILTCRKKSNKPAHIWFINNCSYCRIIFCFVSGFAAVISQQRRKANCHLITLITVIFIVCTSHDRMETRISSQFVFVKNDLLLRVCNSLIKSTNKTNSSNHTILSDFFFFTAIILFCTRKWHLLREFPWINEIHLHHLS